MLKLLIGAAIGAGFTYLFMPVRSKDSETKQYKDNVVKFLEQHEWSEAESKNMADYIIAPRR
jgi:gas vesicle protein